MPYSRVILNLLIVSILAKNVLTQEDNPDLTEEYIDEEFPPESIPDDNPSSTTKPNNSIEVNPKKTQFSEDRFTKLFQARRTRPRPSPLSPKFISKPKPTLPSFIKKTPPIIRVQPTQPPNQRSFTQKTTAAPQLKSTTTRTPARGSGRRTQSSNSRPLNQSTASPVVTSDSSSRRRFGSNSGFRRNSNSTIPAIKPKRI